MLNEVGCSSTMPSFENASRQQVEEFIKQYFQEEEWNLKRATDPKTSFVYEATRPNSDLGFRVGQHKDSKDCIMIRAGFTFNEQEQTMLKYIKIKREVL